MNILLVGEPLSSSIIHRFKYIIDDKSTDLFYFHTQLNLLNWFRSRTFWSRSHNGLDLDLGLALSGLGLGLGLKMFWSH